MKRSTGHRCTGSAEERQVEDSPTTEDCDRYDYHHYSSDDEKEEEETSSSILHDCAPQHPPSPHLLPRSPPPNSHLAAVHRHHIHCRATPAQITDRPSEAVPCSFRWDIELLRALRKDPVSNRREAGKRRQPGRVDMTFIPKKGDLIIHHDRKQWRRVLEFYDPTFQRLHDGDILIRIRIDSYSCLGIILMKGTGYMYYRGYWMFLGIDSDQISQHPRGR